FFGRLFKEGLRQAGAGSRAPQMVFRCDVSRPQWQRNWLSGLANLMCVASEFFRKNDRCLEQKRTEGVTFWHYATANDVRASNLAGEAWALTAYLAGADGILPWQTVEGDRAFEIATPTALLYPGQRFGNVGPLASLRLKALRRGQQDVEYLALLAKR